MLNAIKARVFLLIVATTFVAGCATQGANYEPTATNTRLIERSFDARVGVGEFTKDASSALIEDPWEFRGATKIESPVGDGYDDFVAKAVQDELLLAMRYSDDSGVQITGEMLEHKMSTGSLSIGEGSVAFIFRVEKDGDVVHQTEKRVTHKWDSAFMGVTASINAYRGHLVMVEKLITALFSDRNFTDAINDAASD
jgi:hypothetical protein